MRTFAFWSIGALAAFFVTAGAFLFLANLGSDPGRGDPIPQEPSASDAGPALALRFSKSRLEELENSTGQTVRLYVENLSDEEMPEVDLLLVVTSDSTVRDLRRDYERSLKNLASNERRTIEVVVDLSPPLPAESRDSERGLAAEGTREIVEARASAPGGRSAVRTAVLP